MDIKITKATELKTKPTLEEEASLGFGKRFTDHMFMMNYDNGEWHDARIVPYQRLSLDPSCSVLHYAQEIFEGLKAYRADDGRILMFRAKEFFLLSLCSHVPEKSYYRGNPDPG